MRKFILATVAAVGMSVCLAGAARADNSDLRAQRNQLKLQQKRERNALKLQQHNIKQSWKNGHVSAPLRTQSKHQMERTSRNMKLQQKDAMQDLKDRQRSLKQMQRANGQ
jgi:hypothetical protein